MQILYLCPWPPYPPESRERVRPYFQLRFLSKVNDVDLVCFLPDTSATAKQEIRGALETFCRRVELVPIELPVQQPASLTNLLHNQPLVVRRYFRKDLLKRFKRAADCRHHDLVLLYSAGMVPYLRVFSKLPTIVDLGDVGSLRWQEYADLSPFPASKAFHAEAERLRRLELHAARTADRVVLAAEEEAEAFRVLCESTGRIVSLKTPVNPRPRLHSRRSPEPTLLLAGHLDHFPNADAAFHLLQSILPRILEAEPAVRLVIAGSNPPEELQEVAAAHPRVSLVETSRTIEELYSQAWLVLAPHRIRRGVRNEILEAMALGIPVMATPAAAEGLDVEPGEDLLVEADPLAFAERVVELLHQPERLEELGEHGRSTVQTNYAHWLVATRLEEIVAHTIAGHTNGSSGS